MTKKHLTPEELAAAMQEPLSADEIQLAIEEWLERGNRVGFDPITQTLRGVTPQQIAAAQLVYERTGRVLAKAAAEWINAHPDAQLSFALFPCSAIGEASPTMVEVMGRTPAALEFLSCVVDRAFVECGHRPTIGQITELIENLQRVLERLGRAWNIN